MNPADSIPVMRSPRFVLALCAISVLGVACGGDEGPATAGTTGPATPPVPTASPAASTSPSPMLPSVGPPPSATVPAGVPSSYADDVPGSQLPPDALVPADMTVTDAWPVVTSSGDAVVVAFEDRGADPFVAARGFVVWRRDEGSVPPWRPAFGTVSTPRSGVLAIQAMVDDVTGDRSPDALLVERTGGVGNCGRWWVVDLSTGAPIWRRPMCDAEVVAHRDPPGLEITAIVYEAGDPHCCPSSIRTTVYAYRPPDGFVKVSEETAEL
jgi:hypothetical protein